MELLDILSGSGGGSRSGGGAIVGVGRKGGASAGGVVGRKPPTTTGAIVGKKLAKGSGSSGNGAAVGKGKVGRKGPAPSQDGGNTKLKASGSNVVTGEQARAPQSSPSKAKNSNGESSKSGRKGGGEAQPFPMDVPLDWDLGAESTSRAEKTKTKAEMTPKERVQLRLKGELDDEDRDGSGLKKLKGKENARNGGEAMAGGGASAVVKQKKIKALSQGDAITKATGNVHKAPTTTKSKGRRMPASFPMDTDMFSDSSTSSMSLDDPGPSTSTTAARTSTSKQGSRASNTVRPGLNKSNAVRAAGSSKRPPLGMGTKIHKEIPFAGTMTDSPDVLASNPKGNNKKDSTDCWGSTATLFMNQTQTQTQIRDGTPTQDSQRSRIVPNRRLGRGQGQGQGPSVLVPSSSSNLGTSPPPKRNNKKRLKGTGRRTGGNDTEGSSGLSDDDDDDEDDEATPRAGHSRGFEGRGGSTTPQKQKKKRVPARDDNGAAAFFARADEMIEEDRKYTSKVASQAAEIESVFSSQDELNAEQDLARQMFDDDDVVDELTPEEREYCAQYTSESSVCRFCGELMPRIISGHLQELDAELSRIEAEVTDGHLSWQQYADYCKRHEAEKTVIPLGIRAGYPPSIDFTGLRARLESEEMRVYIEGICDDPARSGFWTEAVEGMKSKGKMMWRAGLQEAEAISRSSSGYYGELGRRIMLDHFRILSKLHLLPNIRGRNPPEISPLSKVDFLQHVLVPEASVRLILTDLASITAGTGPSEENPGSGSSSNGPTAVQDDALRVHRQSWIYGQCQFPDRGREADQVLDAYEEEHDAWIENYHLNRGLEVPVGLVEPPDDANGSDGPGEADLHLEIDLDPDVDEAGAKAEDERRRQVNLSRSTVHSDLISTPPPPLLPDPTGLSYSSSMAAVRGGTRRNTRSQSRAISEAASIGGDDVEGGGGSKDAPIIMMSSQASSNYSGIGDEALLAAAEAAEV